MQQAKYTTECTGHFGLAAEYYCHFTSPIRRYPDLQIHRIIKEHLRGRFNGERKEHYASLLPMVAQETSSLERRADEVEREVDKLKKVEYMADHLGETYTGMISGVTNWGLYVELPNTIEGLVPIATIGGDYYHFVEETYELVGERTNRHFKLGQPVKVMADACDTLARTIDFILVEDEDE
jgi:ribonuclease R